jgi:hypothetical protein
MVALLIVEIAFKTDVEITGKGSTPRERELQAWVPDGPSPAPQPQGAGDDTTFGPGAKDGASWDQFATNQQLFGVTTSYDENIYTTKLDRTGPDFKERERKAQQLADEITGVRYLVHISLIICLTFLCRQTPVILILPRREIKVLTTAGSMKKTSEIFLIFDVIDHLIRP